MLAREVIKEAVLLAADGLRGTVVDGDERLFFAFSLLCFISSVFVEPSFFEFNFVLAVVVDFKVRACKVLFGWVQLRVVVDPLLFAVLVGVVFAVVAGAFVNLVEKKKGSDFVRLMGYDAFFEESFVVVVAAVADEFRLLLLLLLREGERERLR